MLHGIYSSAERERDDVMARCARIDSALAESRLAFARAFGETFAAPTRTTFSRKAGFAVVSAPNPRPYLEA